MSAPLWSTTACGATTLPSDFDILRPCSSRTKPCVRTASYGARPARPAGFEERGMEPAAMLVGAFEIERGRPLQIGPLLQDEAMRRAAVEPDVDDVDDLVVILGGIVVAEEILRIRGEPDIGALALDRRGDAVDDPLVAQRLAGLLVGEDGDRHAPGALTRDAPIGTALDHRLNAVLALGRNPARVVDRGQRLLPQSVHIHADEPLRRVAEDQRRLGAPGMRVGVLRACPARPARRPPRSPR